MLFALTASPRARAAETYYWGGGTADISDNTSVPLNSTGLGGTWSATTTNWANTPFSPNTYSAWQDGSIANFGYFTNSGGTAEVKIAANYNLDGLVINTIGNGSYNFTSTNSSSPMDLAIAGSVSVFGGTLRLYNGALLGGNSDLEKWGGGSLQVRDNNTNFTGNLAVREGTIFLDSSDGGSRNGGLGQVTNISVATALVGKSAGTPVFQYASRSNGIDALNNNAVITLTRGQLILQSTNDATETVGRIDLEGGGILNLSPAAGSSGTLILSDGTQGLTRGANGMGTMYVLTATDGTTKTVVKVANTGNLSVDTLLPWISTSQGQFMKLDSANGNALTTVASATADSTLANWAGSYGTNSNLRVTGALSGALSGDTTVNSLGWSNSVASTLDIGANKTLTVASGGVAVQAGAAVSITNGTLTTSNNAVLYLNVGTGSATTVGSVIAGDIDVVKCGSAQLTFSGSGANIYTGTTYVNCGNLLISKSGSAVGVSGDLVVRDGASVEARGSNPFGISSDVTVDNGYFKITETNNWALGGKLTLNNSLVEIGRNTAASGVQLTGSGTGFAFNGGVVQFTTGTASTNGTLAILTDVSYGTGSATQARFENVVTNGSKFRLALNTGSDAAAATRTFDIADSATLAAGQAEMRVDAEIANGGSGTTTGALRKTGGGVLQLVGTNSYTGGTTVEAGTLQISTLNSAAQSSLSGVVSGSTVTFLQPIAGSFVPGQVLNFNGTESVIWTVVDDYRLALSASPTAGLYSNTITASNFTRTGSIQGNVNINGGTLRIDNSDNTVGGNLSFGGGALEVGLGNTTDYASKILSSTGAIHIRTTNAQNVTLGALDGSNTGGLRKTGEGTLTLSASNAYTGNTTVEAGKLMVNGSIALSSVTVVTNSGTIGGSGSVGDLVIADGGTLAPGNSPGTLFAASATWTNGGSYDWEIFDADGTAGAIDGWDLLDVEGTLTLTGLTNSGFTINLITLSNSTTAGPMANFYSSSNYNSWMIARAATITGFSASLFNLSTNSFANAVTGTFGIRQGTFEGDQALFLTYNGGGEAIPEPGTWAAAALLAATAGFMRWRRRADAARMGRAAPVRGDQACHTKRLMDSDFSA